MKAKYESLKKDIWHKKLFSKLSKKELEFCDSFINSHSDLPKSDVAFKLNRLFIDDIEKPKNRHIMVELMLASL